MNNRMKTCVVVCFLLGAFCPVLAQTVGLEQVIKEVCAKSDSVKMMRESVERSNQMVRERRAAAFPKVSTSVFVGRTYGSPLTTSNLLGASNTIGTTIGSQDAPLAKIAADSAGGTADPNPFAPQELTAYSASVQVSQAIYTFGKIGAGIQVAREFNRAARNTYHRNLQQLQLTALDAFYGALLSEMAVTVRKRSLSRIRELSEFLDRNFKLGSGNKAQNLSMQAELKGQWTEMIRTEQNLRTSRMALVALMGRPFTDSLVLDTTTIPHSLVSAPLPSRQKALESALSNRGDLHSIQNFAKANEGGAKIFRSMYLPSIGVQGSLGTGGLDAQDMTDWDKRTWQIGAGLQWNLFDGFENSARSKQYRSDARKLRVAHEAAEKFIEIEIDAALAECAAADSNQTASREMLSAAKESYDITNENFRQGSGQFAELQLAEERLRQAEMGSLNARYRWMRSRAALRISMGDDIVSLEEK